MGMWIVSV